MISVEAKELDGMLSLGRQQLWVRFLEFVGVADERVLVLFLSIADFPDDPMAEVRHCEDLWATLCAFAKRHRAATIWMRVLCGPLDDHDWDQVNFREPSLNWPDTSLRTVLEFSGVTGQDLPDSASIVGAKGKVSLLSGKWTPVTQ